MGNIAEHELWSGDTRPLSDDEGMSYEDLVNLREHRLKQMAIGNPDTELYTYRNGVNYIKEDIDESMSQPSFIRPNDHIITKTGEFKSIKKFKELRRSMTFNDPNSIMHKAKHYGATNIPRCILMKVLEHYQRDHLELEQIWEAYYALLHDQAIEALEKED